ncbi:MULTISPECIES: basic amino acid ABC transporter substrate-binding protein [Paenibacillus]|uniref:Basic amino acid ABC transporter substrate-binding protein n=1 Tax=Paenibacillus campinasensis TaxID=66347 RepID=A0A268EVM0_9BACL|nr:MULTISPECIES: basic amino acid ABC transporter substrate-binding protein [Paenibacillus]MUG67856.1 transporter substrate-binding domain-containing protein [Paenibacillus campinasensis]PAD77170.1 basic amino acid ABC transporter substrate-binding protein [Paenibacillus campinasensis]PAK48620.1 basic amino acid ABC transporter substrate-binding protein [Paenibacillus sp. 7541]
MKKWGLFLISAILTVSIVGCGSNSNGSGEGAQGGASEGEQVIKFATDANYAPMEYMDKDKIVGFDIDFLAAVMEEAGLPYEVANTGWDTMLASVRQGTEYQAGISSVSITEDRKASYDYTIPYFESTNMIMVKEGSDIQSALDLEGKKVAVQGGTTADIIVSELFGQNNPNISRFDSNTVALMELDKGGADAVVADNAIVGEYIKNNPTKHFIGITDVENFGSEFYAILLPKGSELKAKLDPAIKTVIENGKYAEIYEKWFGETPDITVLQEAAE